METDPFVSHEDKSTLNLNSYLHFDIVTCHSGSLLKPGNNMSNFKYENTEFFLQKLTDKTFHTSEEKALNTNEINKITDEIAKNLPVPIECNDEGRSTMRLLRDTTRFQNDFSKAKSTLSLKTNDKSNFGQTFLFPENKESEELSEKISQDSGENTVLQQKTVLYGPINSNSKKAEDPETKGNLAENVQYMYILEPPILVEMACKLRSEKESMSWNDSEAIPMTELTELNSSLAEMNFSHLPVPVAFFPAVE